MDNIIDSINVGVIGVGVMGEYHTRIYKELEKETEWKTKERIHLVGIADIDSERADNIAKKYGCNSYIDYNDMIRDGVNAVSICVPTSRHKEVAINCMTRGIRKILLEKPIANNVEDALEIVNSARRMGVSLLIGHVERFNPVVLKMKEIIDSGKLGHVVSISAKRVGILPPRINDVGIIVDLAVHDIDVISYLFGEYPTDVYAIDGNLRGMNGVTLGRVGLEDRASIMMKFNDGRAGIIETNWLTPHMIRKLDIVGFDRVAYLDYIEQTISIHGKDMVEDIKLKKEEPLVRELRHFVNVIRNGEKEFITGEDGIHVLRIALAATESYKTGNVVKLGMIIG